MGFDSMTRTAILIDGGHLRTVARRQGHIYDPDFIEAFAHLCALDDEEVIRVFYYDCPPYSGKVHLPISGDICAYEANGAWLFELARRDLFAVRKGELKFRGFALKEPPQKRMARNKALTDEDFRPVFQQKGVDMRIGMDIAMLASRGRIGRIVLVSGDTDCVPAMKHARIEGLQVAIVRIDGNLLSRTLQWHSDHVRNVNLKDLTA